MADFFISLSSESLTAELLEQMIIKEPDCGFMLEKIIFCTDRDGVEDLGGQVIPIIDRRTFHNWEIFQREAEGMMLQAECLVK